MALLRNPLRIHMTHHCNLPQNHFVLKCLKLTLNVFVAMSPPFRDVPQIFSTPWDPVFLCVLGPAVINTHTIVPGPAVINTQPLGATAHDVQ
jgi:hypothetical protein